MTISINASNAQILDTLSLVQDEPARSAPAGGLRDWLPEGSPADIIAKYLSQITTSDVAQVGDLMINGRDNAVLAPKPPPVA
ncbi:MAG TPA: hypothetical protein VL522_21750 [Bordetella sp.]|nr:hypothetical protein [Bordetella sp.]